MSCRGCTPYWRINEATEEQVKWYRRGAIMLLAGRFKEIQNHFLRPYQLEWWMLSVQKELDNLRTEVCGCMGFSPPALELVILRNDPTTVYAMTIGEQQALYTRFEGYPPITHRTQSREP